MTWPDLTTHPPKQRLGTALLKKCSNGRRLGMLQAALVVLLACTLYRGDIRPEEIGFRLARI